MYIYVYIYIYIYTYVYTYIHTLNSNCFRHFRKVAKIHISNMSIYTENHSESHESIRNNIIKHEARQHFSQKVYCFLFFIQKRKTEQGRSVQ